MDDDFAACLAHICCKTMHSIVVRFCNGSDIGQGQLQSGKACYPALVVQLETDRKAVEVFGSNAAARSKCVIELRKIQGNTCTH